MTYVEPVQIQITTAGENLSPMIAEEALRIPEWSDPYIWAFNKIIDNSYNVLKRDLIKEEFLSLLEKVFEDVNNVDGDLGDRAKQRIEGGIDRGPARRLMFFTKNDSVLYTSDKNGLLFLVAEDKEVADREIQLFEENISDFSSVAKDFGVEVKLNSCGSFAETMSDMLDSEVEGRDGFDNQFEETVHEEVSDNITRSIDANITLKFGDGDPEVFEYDMLIHATPSKRIMVEVKDESHDGANLGKSKLIDKPRDKTDIMGTDKNGYYPPFKNTDQTEAFVIVKGMDSEKLEQHRRKAQRRDINLLSYDDGGYLARISDSFKKLTYGEI